MRRRTVLAWLAASAFAARSRAAGAQVPRYAQVVPGYDIRFPHDEGSHPQFRTEWYVTGWIQRERREPAGFQITFFRAKLEIDERNPSALTPREIVIAHAAVSDARRGRRAAGVRPG